MTYEQYLDAVVKRAKEIYPNKQICIDYVREAFNANENIEDAAATVAFDSAWWNGDFPG